MSNLENKFEIINMAPANTTSVLLARGDRCVIFDPWGRADDWVKLLSERGLKPHAIWATHGHPDHISAAPELAARYGIDWHLSHDDLDLIEWGNGLLEYFGLPIIESNYKKPKDIQPGEHEVIPGVNAHAIHIPGHTRGGMALWFPDDAIILVGDTLFQDSYGRPDLPGGNEVELFKSLQKLYHLDLSDDTIVVHGHGPHTTIRWLKQNNRFFGNRK